MLITAFREFATVFAFAHMAKVRGIQRFRQSMAMADVG